MITKDKIEQFYSDVAALGLKFPNAAIKKATGYSSGNVSDILKRNREPSAEFLEAFYRVFPKSSQNVPQSTVSGGNSTTLGADLSALIQNNAILTRAIEKAQDNISRCQEDQRDLIQMLKAERSTVNSDHATVEEMTNLVLGLQSFASILAAQVRKTEPIAELQSLNKMVMQVKRDRESKSIPAAKSKQRNG